MEDRKHRIFLRKPAAAVLHGILISAGPGARGRTPRGCRRSPRSIDFRKEAEGALLEHYAPPALIVDPDLHIVHFQGDTSPYLAPATGQPSFHLLKMVRPELVVDLRTAIYKARKDRRRGLQRRCAVRASGPTRRGAAGGAAISGSAKARSRISWSCFKRRGRRASRRSRRGAQSRRRGKNAPGKTEQLERELASARENLRTLIADHETAKEEMKAANEEVLSSNEELQSTNRGTGNGQGGTAVHQRRTDHPQRRVAAS